MDNALHTADKNREKLKKKDKTFDISYFVGKFYFNDDVSLNYLTFPPIFKTFRMLADNTGNHSMETQRIVR